MQSPEPYPLPPLKAISQQYDELYRRSPFADFPKFYAWVTRLAQPRPHRPVLDIGCGIGGALRALQGYQTTPWGLDLSTEALRQARQHAPESRLIRGDGAQLPFPDNTFDTIFNLGNLEHFVDIHGGIREMRRVLHADGRAWILLPNLYYSGSLWRAIRSGYGPDHHQPIDRFATRNEWRDLLQAGGLHVVRSIPYHKGKWWKRLLPPNLAWHFLYETTPGSPQGKALDALGRVR